MFNCHSTSLMLDIHIEAISAVAAVKAWTEKFTGKFVPMFCDNETAVYIFQVGWGKGAYSQACAQQVWLTCTSLDIKLAVGHIAGEQLTSLTDALSQCYRDRVNLLINDKGVKIIKVFDLTTSL